MDPQFTHRIHSMLRSCFSRKLVTEPSQSSITTNPPHRAHAISPPVPLSSRAVDVLHVSGDDQTPALNPTTMLDP